MPTGYTADVANGKVTDFREYALRCARAFGSFVHMRDDDSDAPLRPDKPRTYYTDQLPKAEAALARLNALTEEQWRDEWQTWWTNEQASYRRRATENAETRKRYETMLAAVDAWRTPSAEHAEFKKFMAEQLKSSIDFDCHDKTPPERPDLPSWRAKQLASAAWQVDYTRAEGRKDRERVEGRNRWAQQLFESLDGSKS